MNELMASALSPEEIAKEFLYHDDPGVKKLALAVVGTEEDEDLESELDSALEAQQEAESEVEELKELLGECLEEIKDPDLIARIKSVT